MFLMSFNFILMYLLVKITGDFYLLLRVIKAFFILCVIKFRLGVTPLLTSYSYFSVGWFATLL